MSMPIVKTEFGKHLDNCDLCRSIAESYPDLELFDHQLCWQGRVLFRNPTSEHGGFDCQIPDCPCHEWLRRGADPLAVGEWAIGSRWHRISPAVHKWRDGERFYRDIVTSDGQLVYPAASEVEMNAVAEQIVHDHHLAALVPRLVAELELAAKRLDLLTNWIQNSYGGVNEDVKLGRQYAEASRAAIDAVSQGRVRE